MQLNEGDTVCNYGEVGRLFYIILEGHCAVKTPAQYTLEGEEQVNPEYLLMYLIRYYRDIDWHSMHNGDLVRRLIQNELDKLFIEIDERQNFVKEMALTKLTNLIQTNKTVLHKKVFKMINFEQKANITITRFREVSRLISGCSFGDLALLNQSAKRAATIECLEVSKFATIDKDDYR